MSSSNAKILLTLLGIALIAAAFFFVVRPKNESIKALEAQNAELQARYDDLCAKEAQKDQFIQETAEFNAQFDEELVNYPADLNQESTVMFLKGVEEAQEFQNVSVSLPRPSTFYVLGQGSAAEGAIAPDDGEDEADQTYVCDTEAYTVTYKGSYAGLKDYMDYIANYKYRMAISQINISYAQDAETPMDECTGSLTLNAYSVSGPDREADVPTVDVKEGKEVIFADINGGSSASTSFDADNGASIVASHNLVMLLNNAGSDTASGIIIAANESNEGTYVTSSSNSVENVKIDITNEDGKNYVTYAIGSNSYKAEVLSSNVTIYVKSSSRVDSNDTNGVNVTINNGTDLAVYVKVADDDTSSPRFNIGSKTGTVKVY